jgi:hypothetical protein
MFKKIARGLKALALSAVAIVGAGVSTANAAVDAAVTTAITDGQADMLTILGALTLMAAAVYVARWILARFV